MTFKIVTEAEFDAFLAAYPRPLRKSYQQIGDPPSTRFYDPTMRGDDAIMATIVWCYGPSGDMPEYRVRS